MSDVKNGLDRQLLLGLLGLQVGLVSRDQLVAAFGVWTGAKERDLGELLVQQGALSADQQALLAALVEQHVKRHGGDPEQSLRSLSSIDSIREDLHQLAEPDLQVSLATVGAAKWAAPPVSDTPDNDPYKTLDAPPPTPEQLAAGGRFVVVKFLAKGGLGSVSIAKDLELNRHVAFKQILPNQADNTDAQVRFKREAEITGGLEHPGIVPVYGLGSYDNGRPFYAMKLIRGDSLKEAIEAFHERRKKGEVGFDSLEFRGLLRRMIDVCNAMQYAHDRGVLHRDLKPGNIMLGRYGETLVVDWGLAKPLAEKEGDAETSIGSEPSDAMLKPRTSLSETGSTETQTGHAKGTPAFMSPEQARGEWDRLGPATDVYALGATLYAVLTGEPPIRAKEAYEALKKAAAGEIASARDKLSAVPWALDAVCRKAMAGKTEDRYHSARGVGEEIDRWLSDEPISAEPEYATERWSRLARKHRFVVNTAVVASILLAGLSALTIWTWWSTEDARELLESLLKSNAMQFELAQVEATLARESERKAISSNERDREFLLEAIQVATALASENDPGARLSRMMLGNVLERLEVAKPERERDAGVFARAAHWRRYDLDRLPDDPELRKRAAKILRELPDSKVGVGPKPTTAREEADKLDPPAE